MKNRKIYIHVPKGFLEDLKIIIVSFLLFYLLDSHSAPGICLIIISLVFIRRITLNTEADKVSLSEIDFVSIQQLQIPKKVEVFEISNEFSVMALYRFIETISSMQLHPKVLIIRMRFLKTIDENTIHALKEIKKQLNKDNTQLLFSSVNPDIHQLFEKSGLIEKIGKENILSDITNALRRAKEIF